MARESQRRHARFPRESNTNPLKGSILATDKQQNTVVKQITLETLKATPAGLGGHISLFPWYDAEITKKDGSTTFSPVLRLCISNFMYLSGYGGGFKSRIPPYIGLKEELEDEVPLWSDFLLSSMESTSPLIFAVEHYRPMNRGGQSPKPHRFDFIVFVHVPGKTFTDLEFKITKEVRGLTDITLGVFHNIVDTTPTIASSGIRIYHRIRYLLKRERSLDLLAAHFKINKQVVKLLESNLNFDHALVELKNGLKEPFSHIMKNNVQFNKNEHKAWLLREEYSKELLSRPSKKGPNDEKEEVSPIQPSVESSMNPLNNGFTVVRGKNKRQTSSTKNERGKGNQKRNNQRNTRKK